MTPTLESAIVRERRIKLLFFIAAILVLLFSLYKVDNLLISMLLAVVNFYILSPAVDFLERKGVFQTVVNDSTFSGTNTILSHSRSVFFPNPARTI